MPLNESELKTLLEVAERATPGPWKEFVCDDGGEWSGWPLSVSSVADSEHTIVRPGGFYPYKWDHKTSQHEAVSNAAHIAAFDPTTCAELVREVLELKQIYSCDKCDLCEDHHG